MKTLLFLVTLLPLLAQARLAKLVSPQEAIARAISSPLVYRGKFAVAGSGSGMESCVFRTSEATIVFEYCRKDAPAVAFRIYPHDRASGLRFYLESDSKIENLRREQYDNQFWAVRVIPQLASFKNDMSMEEHRAYEAELSKTWGCFVLYAEPATVFEKCNPKGNFSAEEGQQWLAQARPFWDAPDEEWYELVKKLVRASAARQ